jgi:hypothetical protein
MNAASYEKVEQVLPMISLVRDNIRISSNACWIPVAFLGGRAILSLN